MIEPSLPPLVVLYTLYARACDPVVGFLWESEPYPDEEIIELVRTCFDGLNARKTPASAGVFTGTRTACSQAGGSKTRFTTWITLLLVNTSVATMLVARCF